MQLIPTNSTSILKAMEYIGNPHEICHKIYFIMQKLMERITELKNDPKAPGQCELNTVLCQTGIILMVCKY